MKYQVTYYDRTEREDGRVSWTKRVPRVFDNHHEALEFLDILGPDVRTRLDWIPPEDARREHHSDFNQDLVMWPGGPAVASGIYCQLVRCDIGQVTWSKFYSGDELGGHDSPFIAASQRAVWDSGMAR